MDNEFSAEFKNFIRTGFIAFELMPASQQRRNKAEHAVQSFKNLFIAADSGVDPVASKDLWSDFIPQFEEALNLLHRGRSGKSAWDDLFSARDFNAVPIAPDNRASWAEHGLVSTAWWASTSGLPKSTTAVFGYGFLPLKPSECRTAWSGFRPMTRNSRRCLLYRPPLPFRGWMSQKCQQRRGGNKG
jgi:hypothetical protein